MIYGACVHLGGHASCIACAKKLAAEEAAAVRASVVDWLRHSPEADELIRDNVGFHTDTVLEDLARAIEKQGENQNEGDPPRYPDVHMIQPDMGGGGQIDLRLHGGPKGRLGGRIDGPAYSLLREMEEAWRTLHGR